MRFYACSPSASRFLVKEAPSLRSRDVAGRFSGKPLLRDTYPKMYGKQSLYRALDEWGVIAKDAGISKAALVYR